jgi:glycosyltransferase involved in cell wall biosynthesis
VVYGRVPNCGGSPNLGISDNLVSGKTGCMKLSVMIITYNHERFIKQAIESVLAQRVNFDYEIIIGDDCSTDGTRDIIMDFHRRYPGRLVSILRKQNMGAMRNVEATLAACRGQYLASLEGDDYWTCDAKLQRQVDFLDRHPDHAICCHRGRVLNETDKSLPDVIPDKPAGSYTIEDLFEYNWIMTCSVVYRWGLIGKLPDWFTEMKLGDWPLNALVARFGKINLMDDVMAVYRAHSGGVWSSRPRSSQLYEITRMLLALDKQLDFQYTRAIRRTLARSYFDMACQARHDGSQDGSRTETLRHLVNCLRNRGWQLPSSRWTLARLATYVLIGASYRVFSRAKKAPSD